MYRSKPPGALVVDRRVELDPGALPRFRERIPYVVVLGQGGTYDQSKLKDLVLSPEEFLAEIIIIPALEPLSFSCFTMSNPLPLGRVISTKTQS